MLVHLKQRQRLVSEYKQLKIRDALIGAVFVFRPMTLFFYILEILVGFYAADESHNSDCILGAIWETLFKVFPKRLDNRCIPINDVFILLTIAGVGNAVLVMGKLVDFCTELFAGNYQVQPDWFLDLGCPLTFLF